MSTTPALEKYLASDHRKAFVRALDAEIESTIRAITREVNLQIWGPAWASSDRYYYRWPEFEIVPGWFRARERWHRMGRPYRWARRWRNEIAVRVDLAWRALKGEDFDW